MSWLKLLSLKGKIKINYWPETKWLIIREIPKKVDPPSIIYGTILKKLNIYLSEKNLKFFFYNLPFTIGMIYDFFYQHIIVRSFNKISYFIIWNLLLYKWFYVILPKRFNALKIVLADSSYFSIPKLRIKSKYVPINCSLDLFLTPNLRTKLISTTFGHVFLYSI